MNFLKINSQIIYISRIGMKWLCLICLIGTIPLAGAQADITAEKKNVIFEEFSSNYHKLFFVPRDFQDYIRPPDEVFLAFDSAAVKNWRVLLSDVDRLPHQNGGSPVTTACQISELCERLPPLEYLDLLDRLLDLVEQKKMFAGTVNLRFGGTEGKNQFITVNYQHPRVKQLIERAKKVCADDAEMMEFLRIISTGELADAYQVTNGPDFFPEVLPGVRLRHPNEGIIRKYERVTGKKVTRLPGFESKSMRVPRREGTQTLSSETAEEMAQGIFQFWNWAIGGLVVLAVVVFQRIGALAFFKKIGINTESRRSGSV